MHGPLYPAARQLLAAYTEEEVYDAAVAGLDRIVDAQECVLALADDGGLVTQERLPQGLVDMPAGLPVSDPKGIIAHSFEIDSACVIADLADVRSVDSEATSTEPAPYHSLVCAPFDDYGTLIAVDESRGRFSKSELEQAEQLASLVAAALDRIHARSSGPPDNDLSEEVAAILSHDVANSLTVAHGYLDMAREERDSDNLETVASSLDRFQDLVDDLVTLLRTGERVTELVEIELETIAVHAWKTVEAPDVELDVVDSGLFKGDETSVSQLLENLFRNAVEHGGDAVTIRVGVLSTENGFFVEDDGSGIPAEVRSELFDYGVSSTSEQTGFGLSIVRWIADAHGWEVTVGDEDADGARFEVTNVEFVAD